MNAAAREDDRPGAPAGPPKAGTDVSLVPQVFPPPETATLASGARVVLRPTRANDIVALRMYLPMGPLYEAEEESGLSNLLQEMLLHGTLRRSEEELQDALADLGVKLDTGTANDYGSLTLRVARPELERALDLFEEVVTQPALDEEELRKEKVRVLNRIKVQNDSLLAAAFELFRETFYEGHPYHKPILGYPHTVRPIERRALQDARERWFQPHRLVVSAVGHLEPDLVLRRIERLALPTSNGALPSPPGGIVRHAEPREVTKRRESLAAWIVIGFPAPSFVDPDHAAARLLDAVLGGTMNSRLFTELREKRSLAYQVSSYYNDQRGHSFLAGYIGTSAQKYDEARAAMLHEFRRFSEERVPDAELERAKRYLRGAYIVSAETNAAQAARMGRYELYELGQDFGDRLLERVAAVTSDEIRALAEKWFGPHVLAAIRPDDASLARLAETGEPDDLFETTGMEEEEPE
ncbi:MAG TPA: pitrilysin family protein [Gemmatimonadota bacterium]